MPVLSPDSATDSAPPIEGTADVVGSPAPAVTAASPPGAAVDRADDLVYLLRPGTVLVRRDATRLRIGLVRDRAVELTCPAGCPPAVVAAVLSSLDGTEPLAAVLRRHGLGGTAASDLAEAFAHLESVGHLCRADTPDPTGPGGRPVHTVHLVGNGALAQRLVQPLRMSGCLVSSSPHPGLSFDPSRPPWARGGRRTDLVVLADVLVVDPLVSRTLVAEGVPHLHIHCRDGRVVVGPTVRPGATSCLRCADLHRADRDPAWPLISAGLLGVVSSAPVPALATATALVLSEVAASRGSGGDLQTAGATVEVSPGEGMWHRVWWPPHERCGCGAFAATAGEGTALP